MSPRSRSAATALAAACLFGLTYLVLCRTRLGQELDSRVFTLVLEATPSALARLLATLARPSLLVGMGTALGLLVLRSLLSAPRRVGIAVAGLLAVPLGLWVRQSWRRPDLGVGGYLDNTFPSTHATAGIALLLGLLVLWPRPLGRPEAWGAGAVAAVVLLGNLSEHDHRPADVLGSALLALAVAAAAAALLGEPLARLARGRGRLASRGTTRARSTDDG